VEDQAARLRSLSLSRILPRPPDRARPRVQLDWQNSNFERCLAADVSYAAVIEQPNANIKISSGFHLFHRWLPIMHQDKQICVYVYIYIYIYIDRERELISTERILLEMLEIDPI
jgi:hypothetical protein